MKARPPSQKRLSNGEIKKMVYLSQVRIVGYNLSSIYFMYYYITLLGIVRNLRYTKREDKVGGGLACDYVVNMDVDERLNR
jgi:hypothetical protein